MKKTFDQPSLQLSIVIPVLNDAEPLNRLLSTLHDLLTGPAEVLVVDGGSADSSALVALESGARVLQAPPGRGRQLNSGCQAARGQWLWLLHADSLPSRAAVATLESIAAGNSPQASVGWGRFDICFDAHSALFQLLAAMMNARSRLTGICTGDQGMFLHRRLLSCVGGVPEQPLMEDIELSRRLGRFCRPACRPETLQTSARRWQQAGWWRTVLGMWRLRLRYWLGAAPEQLAVEYYGRS